MKAERDHLGVLWTEDFANIQGFTCYFYYTTPEKSLPKLFFLHGGGGNGPSNIPVLSPLSEYFQVFVPSARGFGKSVNQEVQVASTTLVMVEDLAALIRHVSPNEPVFLVGHSMGATVAPRVAKKYPELVKGVILEDPAWLVLDGEPLENPPEMIFGPPPPGENVPFPFESEHGKEKSSGGPAGRGGHGGQGGHGGHGGRGGRGGHGGHGGPPGGKMRKGLGDDVSNQAVAEVTVPTMIFTGGPEAHCKRDVLEATLKTYSRAEEFNFPAAGHDIHGWFPEEWREQVKRFFLSIEEGK